MNDSVDPMLFFSVDHTSYLPSKSLGWMPDSKRELNELAPFFHTASDGDEEHEPEDEDIAR